LFYSIYFVLIYLDFRTKPWIWHVDSSHDFLSSFKIGSSFNVWFTVIKLHFFSLYKVIPFSFSFFFFLLSNNIIETF
jgi:hypothetical protein